MPSRTTGQTRAKEFLVPTYILIIDDDMNTVYDVHPALAQEGYRVQHSLPGRNAIRQILLEEPDLVILGINVGNGEWVI